MEKIKRSFLGTLFFFWKWFPRVWSYESTVDKKKEKKEKKRKKYITTVKIGDVMWPVYKGGSQIKENKGITGKNFIIYFI